MFRHHMWVSTSHRWCDYLSMLLLREALEYRRINWFRSETKFNMYLKNVIAAAIPYDKTTRTDVDLTWSRYILVRWISELCVSAYHYNLSLQMFIFSRLYFQNETPHEMDTGSVTLFLHRQWHITTDATTTFPGIQCYKNPAISYW